MFLENGTDAAKITVGWISFIAAVVAAIVSLIGVLIGVYFTRKSSKESLDVQKEIAAESRRLQTEMTERNAEITAEIEGGRAFFNTELENKKQGFQKELEVEKHVFQKELEIIKATFDDENAEKKARRDYEYEARQRLYREIEPLIFQLTELGEDFIYRIAGLAGEARNGNLRPDGGWLSDPWDYYTTSNMYKLLAPLAIVKLIQRKLTSVDLNLVPRISKLYKIARFISWSLTDDFEIKKITGLSYDPNNPDWKNLRDKNQSVYWRQGIPTGRLDKVINLIIDEPNGRCVSFGRFEAEYYDQSLPLHSNFQGVFDIFRNFHPQTRPILWRILIVQAHLYHCLLQNRDLEKTNDTEIIPVTPLRSQKVVYGDFDWRSPNSSIRREEALVEPFKAAEIYLKQRLKSLYQEEYAYVET
jgi:hypothetical protein